MATRPVFLPSFNDKCLVQKREFDFPWASGFSEVQKRKNINALHAEARKQGGIRRILEISSKSEEEVGKRLSAFSLKIALGSRKYPLESVYQGSKVFENGGGPFTEVFGLPPRDAKRFVREKDCGRIVRFELAGNQYPPPPKTAFYDWLYIRSLADEADWISENVKYDAFTDIEFNPAKQFNCQARAFAVYLSLHEKDKLEEAAADFEAFEKMLVGVDSLPLFKPNT